MIDHTYVYIYIYILYQCNEYKFSLYLFLDGIVMVDGVSVLWYNKVPVPVCVVNRITYEMEGSSFIMSDRFTMIINTGMTKDNNNDCFFMPK